MFGWSPSCSTRYGRRLGIPGCNTFQRSTSMPSRRNSVHDVTDHASEDTLNSSASSCCALSTSFRIAPEPKRLTRGWPSSPNERKRYMPRMMPSRTLSSSGMGG